jgi:hypothetical protein
MDKAERVLPIPEHAANDPSTNAGTTVEQLRAQLDRIMKAEANRRLLDRNQLVPA